MEKCMADFLAWDATLKHVEDSIDRRSANLTYERDEIKAKQRGIVCGTRVAASQEQTSRAALNDVSRLPKDFPTSLESDLAWDVTQFKSDADYIVYLTDEHLLEIDIALDEFKKLGLDGDLVRRNNFQLPTLEGDLSHLRHEIHNGKGFGLIRGLEVGTTEVNCRELDDTQSYVANLKDGSIRRGICSVSDTRTLGDPEV
ncbi:hypothetical protein E4U19_001493 [Claviceps sp. Clav32 group G5]|nr:hypothetical protein E4U19_001493 [Claviceps sp. Clav32 group G5]